MTWYRIEREALDSDVPVLWLDFEDLPVFPSVLGFVEFGRSALPHTVMSAHITSPTTIEVSQVYEHRGHRHRRTLTSAVFPNPHSAQWLADVRHRGVLLVLVGDTLPVEVSYPFPVTQAEALANCMAGLVHLSD